MSAREDGKKTIGVIGGLGPMAGVYLTELITSMTAAGSDQEHPRMLMYSIPDTPDRTEFILSGKEDPCPYLIGAAQVLADAGADFLVIPCVTAQYFYERICEAVDIPVVSLCADVAGEAARLGIRSVALFATDGTIRSGVLEKDFVRHRIGVIRPEEEEQAEVMRLIYDVVKKGVIDTPMGREEAIRDLHTLADRMCERGAERVILGCTELSLIRREALRSQTARSEVFLDILEILARTAVIMSGSQPLTR